MRGRIHLASSMEDAEAAVCAGATPLAGATWIMRAPIRREISPAAGYVALSRIPALRDIDVTESEIRIGACARRHSSAACAIRGMLRSGLGRGEFRQSGDTQCRDDWRQSLRGGVCGF
jgi:CO/xanthine dehydrogenase FAD-binding subunit